VQALALTAWVLLLAGAADPEAPALPPAVIGPVQGLRWEVGFGSPTGFLGVSAWRDFSRPIRLEGGVGLGISGLQLGGMLKAVVGERNRFVPGAGVSLGLPLGNAVLRDQHGGSPVVMPWLNLDILGIEHVTDSGGLGFFCLGLVAPMRHAHYDITELGQDVHPFQFWLPQLRAGHTF
jgi:hypothetical protein